MSNELIHINDDHKGIKFLVHFIIALGTTIIITAALMFVFDGDSDNRETKMFWSIGESFSNKSNVVGNKDYEPIVKDGEEYVVRSLYENTLHFEKGGICYKETSTGLTTDDLDTLSIPSNCRVASLEKIGEDNYTVSYTSVSGDSLLTFLLDIPLGIFGVDVDTPFPEEYVEGVIQTPKAFVAAFTGANIEYNVPLLWLYTIGEVITVLGVIKLVGLFKGSYIYIYVTVHDKVSHGAGKGKNLIGKVSKFVPDSESLSEGTSKPAKAEKAPKPKKEKPVKKEEPKSLFSDDDE